MSDAEARDDAGPILESDEYDTRELQDRIDELETRLDELETAAATRDTAATKSSVRVALAKIADAIDGDIDPSNDIAQQGDSVANALEDLAETVRKNTQYRTAVTSGKQGPSTVDEAWTQVVDAARNRRGTAGGGRDDDVVVLYGDDIAQATGYSERHALNLIEKFGDEKSAADWKSYESASAGNSNKQRRKRLLVNLEEVRV